MSKRRRWLWWLAAVVIGLPALALLALRVVVHGFGPAPSTLERLHATGAPAVQRTVAMREGHEVHVVEVGRSEGPLVLFVHGTPGGWQDFADVMQRPELSSRARLVGMDRLGWGGSAVGGLAPRLSMQAAAVLAVLEAHPANRPAILVGHSLGGAVIARAAMDAPELVDALVVIAGSIDPELERTTWYQAVARSALVRWAIPEPLVRAADELAPLRSDLVRMLPLWSSLELPVTVIQGEEDALVRRENADFAERVLTHAPLVVERIPRQGHLIPWERPELIAEAVLRLLVESGHASLDPV